MIIQQEVVRFQERSGSYSGYKISHEGPIVNVFSMALVF